MGVNPRKLGGCDRTRPTGNVEQSKRTGRIRLGLRRVVVSAAPLRIHLLGYSFTRVLLDEHSDIELAHRSDIELLVVLKVVLEVRNGQGLNLLARQVGF